MKFVTNNIVFLTLTGLFGFLFLALFAISLYFSNSGNEVTDDIDGIKADIKNLHNKKLPYLGIDHDLKLAAVDLYELASIERAQNRLWKTVLAPESNIFVNWKSKSEEVINSALIRQFTRLNNLCKEKNISLPGNGERGSSSPFGEQIEEEANDFGFGMTAYDGNWPNFSNEEAQLLGIQIDIIKELVGYLCDTVTDEHSAELVHLTRESVGRTDGLNIGMDQVDLSAAKSVLLKTHVDLESQCFEVCFIGHTSHARTFLNSLRPPYFLRNLIVERESSENSFSNGPSFGPDFPQGNSSSDDSEVPVVQDVRSKFTFLVEYVTSVNRNPDEFYRAVLRKENFDEEFLGEFLLKAGHEKLFKPLIEFLSKKDDA
tara:strand:- start:1388 stop:2506 length:1119 start_codon:yes stop_codon:yes gene_type:complete